MIMSIIRSSRNPRLPQLQPLSARYNLIQENKKKANILSHPQFAPAPICFTDLCEMGYRTKVYACVLHR